MSYYWKCTWPGCEQDSTCLTEAALNRNRLRHLDAHIHQATYYIDTYMAAKPFTSDARDGVTRSKVAL